MKETIAVIFTLIGFFGMLFFGKQIFTPVYSKILSILTGWYYLAFKRDKVEDMANRRAKICVKCPYAKFSNFDIVWDKRIPSISGKHCQICGCPLATKLRSAFEECPDNRWQEEKL